MIRAKSVLTRKRNSLEAGQEAAREIVTALGAPPRVVFTYLTVNHDQPLFLKGLHDALGPEAACVGSSGQGVMGRGAVHEDGYAASVCGLSGDLTAAAGSSREIQTDTRAKGAELGRALKRDLRGAPRVLVLHYDPLCGADIGLFLDGLYEQIECPVVGGASGHLFSAALMTTTYQHFGREVFSHGAVAVALSGDFTCELAICTGCSPVGIDMTVTRAEGNLLLELDGRPAAAVWRELTGAPGPTDPVATSALAVGVPMPGADKGYSVRAAFMHDPNNDGLVLQAGIAEGTRVSLHHRTTQGVLDGAAQMADELERRLSGKQPRVVLGFECGARTLPFLGAEATQLENRALQARFAPEVEWAGVICWGEVFPVPTRPGFHNYTYPLLVLAD